jgi:deazaflavin-dependent oxidoreductase (nitroreductase family)
LRWRWVEWLFVRVTGVPLMVLETVGRRSGRRHTVVVDVLDYDAARDVYYVQPANGRRSDWVRNALAQPEVTARVGDRTVRARVRDVTGEEGAMAFMRFIRRHPRYARLVAHLVGHVAHLERPDAELLPDLARVPTFAVDVETPRWNGDTQT